MSDLYGLVHHWFIQLGMNDAVATIICVLVSIGIPYVLGSLNFGVIWSALLYKDDVRAHGSGNAGSTNMLRSYGKKAAIMTLLGDMLKTALSCFIGILLGPAYYGLYISGLFCMLGHMFPVFFKFKGGKGVACLAIMVLMTDIRVFAVLIIMFFILVIGTKFVSLGSVICAMLYPVLLNRLNAAVPFGWLIATMVAFLIVFMHRENLKRLFEGKENKISLGKKKKAVAENIAEKDSEN